MNDSVMNKNAFKREVVCECVLKKITMMSISV
jgi:hypothetical protein